MFVCIYSFLMPVMRLYMNPFYSKDAWIVIQTDANTHHWLFDDVRADAPLFKGVRPILLL